MEEFKFDPNYKSVPGEIHIFLAEDGIVHARILHAFLTRAKYKFSWVDNGQAAYDAIKGGFKPDLFITDVNMPGMTGFELLTRLNSENLLPPTIVLTGAQKEEDVLRGLQCGALDYIKKPFSPSVVLARIQIILSTSKLKVSNG